MWHSWFLMYIPCCIPRCKGKFEKIKKKCTQEGAEVQDFQYNQSRGYSAIVNILPFITFKTQTHVKKYELFPHITQLPPNQPTNLFQSPTSTSPKMHERIKNTHMLELTFDESSNTNHRRHDLAMCNVIKNDFQVCLLWHDKSLKCVTYDTQTFLNMWHVT